MVFTQGRGFVLGASHGLRYRSLRPRALVSHAADTASLATWFLFGKLFGIATFVDFGEKRCRKNLPLAAQSSSMDAAKELFFRYDGSAFYMSRDGVDREYAQYNIPKSAEQKWLTELKTQKLAALDHSGNFLVIHFLIHHGDFTRLSELLAASPLGKLWEKTTYLELLLNYLSECRNRKLFGDQIEDGYLRAESFAEGLLRRARSTKSKARIQAVIDTANSARGG